MDRFKLKMDLCTTIILLREFQGIKQLVTALTLLINLFIANRWDRPTEKVAAALAARLNKAQSEIDEAVTVRIIPNSVVNFLLSIVFHIALSF